MKNLILSILCLTIITCSATKLQKPTIFPDVETVTLSPYSKFDFSKIDESSAIVKSRTWDNLYWTLNDSGAKNRIFPINRNGELYRAEWYKEKDGGVFIGDAVNIDWEEMAIDNNGNLYIGACGNNSNKRRDLAIYILKDPDPLTTGTTRISQKIRFYYPEQKNFPAIPNNYDCEAIFWANDKLYLLTKHRADTRTHLYRFDKMDQLKNNPVTRIGTFDIQGMVTAADASIDGKKLAVLTYDNVWLFEAEDGNYFEGKKSWLPISAKQCEAICFDGDKLIITNEQMELFELPLTDLIPVN